MKVFAQWTDISMWFGAQKVREGCLSWNETSFVFMEVEIMGDQTRRPDLFSLTKGVWKEYAFHLQIYCRVFLYCDVPAWCCGRVVVRNLQLFLMRILISYCTGLYDEVSYTRVGFSISTHTILVLCTLMESR